MKKREKNLIEEYNSLADAGHSSVRDVLYDKATAVHKRKMVLDDLCRQIGFGDTDMTLRMARQEEILEHLERGDKITHSDWAYAFGTTKTEQRLLRAAGCAAGLFVGICIGRRRKH